MVRRVMAAIVPKKCQMPTSRLVRSALQSFCRMSGANWFCSVVLEVVQVNRNNGSLVGFLEGNDLELFDDKRLRMDVDVNRRCTHVSAGNAELVEEATSARGGVLVDNSPEQWVVFSLHLKQQ